MNEPNEAVQVEMPFAMVLGEPLTEMPRDLYIPPQAMEVFLDAFEGPLDLLLYLIRRQNLNILDIPIAEITRQYTNYIEVMTELPRDLYIPPQAMEVFLDAFEGPLDLLL